MRVSLSWLREFVDLDESPEELREILDDLGLVVEGIERVGAGLEDVVVARVDEIRAIPGADRVRLVVADAGEGPIEIVCGATNFEVGQHVPLAPVGAVLPGDFVISRRTMRGVTSNGMLCSARELKLSDDHEGLMILDGLIEPRVGEPLIEALGLEPDVIFDLSIEGNRPDAWSIEGVARDLATRLDRPMRAVALARPDEGERTASVAGAGIEDPELCGRLTVSMLRNVTVKPSPAWIARRLEGAGMRSISNIVDASNLVMLELGQPTHPYDAERVAARTLRARRARPGETLTTLDGVERELARAGSGLGDTGVDCVIVDGEDRVIGLAGVMGGASSEITEATTEVLLEAAYFDPMAIARSAKRHGLRSEASARFERGVDPELALRAVGRFVELVRESVPELEWMAEPIDVRGVVPTPATIELRQGDVERLLGVEIEPSVVRRLLAGLGFSLQDSRGALAVTAPSNRPDVREGDAGRADVIEEVARLYGYRSLARHYPAWPEVGGLTARQRFRRRLRDAVVDLGALEAWTASLVSESEFNLLGRGRHPVRVTNPLNAEESVLRATLITGLVRAWARNEERGRGEVVLAEFGNVFIHPAETSTPRRSRGGVGGALNLELPEEIERLSVVLGRRDDDASSAVAWWRVLAGRLGLAEVVARSLDDAPSGWHPTRTAALVDRASGALLGHVGEADPELVAELTTSAPRRLGLVDLDLEALSDPARATRASELVDVPSRYPSAVIDLAFVTPQEVNAEDLAFALRRVDERVERVELFDVYRGPGLAEGTRSLAYNVRLSSRERTLNDAEVAALREALIEAAGTQGAALR